MHFGRIATTIGFEGRFNDAFGSFPSMFRMDTMVNRAGDFVFIMGGYDGGVIIVSNSGDTRHDALHIDNHRIHGTCDHDHFLTEIVRCHWYTMTQHGFVACAADADDVDAVFCAECFGFVLIFFSHCTDRFCNKRVMAIDGNVDRLLVDNAKISLTDHRGRGAKKNVRQFSRQCHAVKVRNSSSHPSKNNICWISITANRSSGDRLCNGHINIGGKNTQFLQ